MITNFLFPAIIIALLILLFLIERKGRQERKRFENERIRMNEAKLHFFTDISYDLRNPLSMIISPLDKIIGEHAGEPIAKELTPVIHNARMLMEEIDRILDFKQLTGKEPEFHPSYGDIAKFTAEVCRSFAAMMGKEGDSLTVDTLSGPIMTGFDRNQIRRILQCILRYTYMHGRGEGPLRINVDIRQDGGKALICISDNGKGLGEKTKQLIMDRASSDDNKNIYGYTIGFDIIMEYVRRHNGEVTFSENDPSGNIYTLSFPINDSMKPAKEMHDGNRLSERTGRPLILNVEDNPAFRYFVTENLSSRYDIVEAENGKEALELIADNSFDLILSDVVMPEMDGRELCRAVRRDIRYANTPIILLTTYQDEYADLENLQAGADDTIKKPFNIESLIIRMERLLKRKAPILTDTDASGRRMSRADKELLERIVTEIEKNLQDSEYTIESLCDTLSISRSGLYKKMVILTGKSPLEFIRLRRLEKGREMLENGETSVSQIAWNVGFSPKQFSKHFKDEFGSLPSEYIHSMID